MLYRDYARRSGEWVPNVHGGRENLEAIAFLRRMNEVVYGNCEGVMTLAEESTSYPAVSQPTTAASTGTCWTIAATPACAPWCAISTSSTARARASNGRSEEHTSELQSLMRISYAVFCLKK